MCIISLLFIRQLYDNVGVEQACERVCISKQMGYIWLEEWNALCYDGLTPRFGGCRPPKLSEDGKEKFETETQVQKQLADFGSTCPHQKRGLALVTATGTYARYFAASACILCKNLIHAITGFLKNAEELLTEAFRKGYVKYHRGLCYWIPGSGSAADNTYFSFRIMHVPT